MRKVSAILFFVLSLSMGGMALAQDLKAGFIDAQKVLESSREGKRVKATMEEYVRSRQKIIDLEEGELKQIQEELNRQGALLSSEAKKVKESEFQNKVVEYQKKAAEMTKEVQVKKISSLKDFNRKLEEAVKQVAEKEGYLFVFDKNTEGGGVIYAKETFDMTMRVIEQIDRGK